MSFLVDILMLLVVVLLLFLAWVIFEEFFFKKPRRTNKVSRKKRKMFKLLDKRFGLLFEVVHQEAMGRDRAMLHLRSGSFFAKIPYYDWEIAPAKNLRVLAGKGVAIFEYVGDQQTPNQTKENLKRSMDSMEIELLKKKVVEKDAYENQKAMQTINEAIRLTKAKTTDRDTKALRP